MVTDTGFELAVNVDYTLGCYLVQGNFLMTFTTAVYREAFFFFGGLFSCESFVS